MRSSWEPLVLRGCNGRRDTRLLHRSGQIEVAVQPYPDGFGDVRYLVEVYAAGGAGTVDECRERLCRPLGTTASYSTGLAVAVAAVGAIEAT